MIIQHLFTFDYYSAFLKASGLQPSELATAYMPYEGKDLQADLAKTEQLGFYKNGKLTVKAEKIAKVICEPEKTILVNNPSAGENSLCIYNYYKGLWIYLVIDYKLGLVSLTSPVLPEIIRQFVISSTFGNWQPKSFENIYFSLTNDELNLFNLSLFILGKRFKALGRPLTKEESIVNLKFIDKDILKEVLVADFMAETNLLEICQDDNRYQTAVKGLLSKDFLTKTDKEDSYLYGECARKYMVPNGGNVRISFKDLGTGKHKKYFVTPDRLFEISVTDNSTQFATVENIDFTFWETAPTAPASQEKAAAPQTVVEEKKPETSSSKQETVQSNEAPQQELVIKFCPFCGSKVVLQGQFCTNCGKKFPER